MYIVCNVGELFEVVVFRRTIERIYKGYNLQRIGLWDNQRFRIAKKMTDQQL
jgi:hypothetical protein